eukprot:1382070-Rhodomonas_salina.1
MCKWRPSPAPRTTHLTLTLCAALSALQPRRRRCAACARCTRRTHKTLEAARTGPGPLDQHQLALASLHSPRLTLCLTFRQFIDLFRLMGTGGRGGRVSLEEAELPGLDEGAGLGGGGEEAGEAAA